MRRSLTVTAIAITLASGLSFAAADKEGQSQSDSHMMGGGMHMGMMEDMRKMMDDCRGMMDSMSEKNAAAAKDTGV